MRVRVDYRQLLVDKERAIVGEEEEEGSQEDSDTSTPEKGLQAPQHAEDTLNRQESDSKDQRCGVVREYEWHRAHHKDQRNEKVDHGVVQQPRAVMGE